MQTGRTIVNVHIEKTAGTSLLRFFENTVGKKRVAFYDPTTDSLIRVSDLFLSPSNTIIDRLQLKSYAFWPMLKQFYFSSQRNKRSSTSVPSDIAIVHGHFAANRFDTMLPDAIRTVVIRDPLRRMHSQYDHWRRAKGRNQWRVIIPYDPAMTFEDYAMLPAMRNYQVNALAGRELASFSLVGVTERLDAYTQALYAFFSAENHVSSKTPPTGVKNLNKRKKNHTITNDFEKAFYAYHKDDYDLYEQAKKIAA